MCIVRIINIRDYRCSCNKAVILVVWFIKNVILLIWYIFLSIYCCFGVGYRPNKCMPLLFYQLRTNQSYRIYFLFLNCTRPDAKHPEAVVLTTLLAGAVTSSWLLFIYIYIYAPTLRYFSLQIPPNSQYSLIEVYRTNGNVILLPIFPNTFYCIESYFD